MGNDKLTHYRKAFNSPYLSAADVNSSVVLQVGKVVYELDQTKRSKEYFNVIYFTEKKLPDGEPLKPMILNAGNNEIIRKFAGGKKYLEEWKLGFKITIYVLEGIKFGRDLVDGLRINPEPPMLRKPDLLPDTKYWTNAIIAYKRDGNFDAIEQRMTVSEKHKTLIAEIVKKELKEGK